MKVLQYAPITEELRSEVLTNQKALKEAGAFAFTNDGVGVQTAGTMYLAMKEAAALNMALVAHTEDESLLFGGVMHEGEVSKKLGLPGILCNGSFTNCSGYYFSKRNRRSLSCLSCFNRRKRARYSRC